MTTLESPGTPGTDHTVERISCPLPARAWWGDQLVAESTATVRVEETGQPPSLYFPRTDVRFDLVRDEGRQTTCPVKGTARLWSIDPGGPGRDDDGGDRQGGQSGQDGHDVLWSFAEPSPALGWLRHLVAFDHDRVRVELMDTVGSDTSDVTVKRFPTWGDASDILDQLDVRPDGERRWIGIPRADWRRPVVEGSQMLGQAIVAAGRHAPGRRAVSAHMVFVRPADARQPLQFDLDEVSGGRTFTALGVNVGQARRCATGTLLLDVTAPDVIRHAVAPPDVAGPEKSEPYDMSVTGRDVRIVGGAYTDDPDAPTGPPILDAWVRFRDVPDDPALHAGLLAHFTGHLSIATAFRPHAGVGQQQAHRTLSTAVNAISLSIHGEVRADRWLLYRHHSTFAGDGMTHSEGRVHNEGGALLASFSVESMVRRFPGSNAAVDERTAL